VASRQYRRKDPFIQILENVTPSVIERDGGEIDNFVYHPVEVEEIFKKHRCFLEIIDVFVTSPI